MQTVAERLPNRVHSVSSSSDEKNLYLLIDDLCRASTPDERSRLAEELRNAVDSIKDVAEQSVFREGDIHERGPAVASIVRRLQSMLTGERSAHRLAAIAAVSALLRTDSESVYTKIQRTSNAIRALYSTTVTDIPTSRAAARLVGAFARINNPLSDRSVETVLLNAINLIGTAFSSETPHPVLSMDRARATMLVAELATQERVPIPIFKNEKKLRGDLWLVICDRDPFVREQGVRGLRAILKALAIRTRRAIAEGAMRETMDVIRCVLDPAANGGEPCGKWFEKLERSVFSIHGSLVMLAHLLRTAETKTFMHKFSSELGNLILPYQNAKEREVRQAVADILPLMVKLDRDQFAIRFMNMVHESTLRLIQDENFPAEERGRSLKSLAVIAQQMPDGIDTSPVLSDLLRVCRKSLKALPAGKEETRIPEEDVLNTISCVAKSSKGREVLEKELRGGLLYDMFETDFTNNLVTAVDAVGRAVPSFAEPVRERLVHLIAATLKKRLPNKKYAIARNLGDVRDENYSTPAGSVTRTHSLISLTASSSQGPPRRKRVPNSISKEEERALQDAGLVRQLSARNFFQQVAIAEELHRIDSSCVLTSTCKIATLDGVSHALNGAVPENTSHELESMSFLGGDDDLVGDKENSPCVALKAIVNYDFKDMRVEDFCSFTNEFVIGYIEYNRVKVRALAVAASVKLMISAAKLWVATRSLGKGITLIRREIHSTLAQILSIAVADPSTDVRYVAIRALNQRVFFPYLLQPEMLSSLCMCFHDESLAIRASALSLAGLLSQGNTAHALPALRYQFIYLIRVLRCDGTLFSRDRREATELLYTLVHNGKDLVFPFTGVLVQTLMSRLQEVQQANDTALALPVLLTIAEMGGTMGKIDLKCYQDEMVPLLVESVLSVQGADSMYQKAALRAFTSFVQNTGFVIKPYAMHSTLLPELIRLLRSEGDASVRLLAENLLGSLGAVDPADNKYAVIPEYSRQSRWSREHSFGSESFGRSISKRDISGSTMTSTWGGTASSRSSQTTKGVRKADSALQQRTTPQNHVFRTLGDTHAVGQNGQAKVTRTSTTGSGNGLQDSESESVSLLLFTLGGTYLRERLEGYQACWAADSFPTDVLLDLLDHPFTANTEYFPSIALDGLHKVLANPRLRLHHREISQAIVNIMRSVGSKCTNFLSAVVPRVLWLLEHSSSKQSGVISFTLLQQHIMQRLGDIITIAGHNYIPFAFDTVLLMWMYLQSLNMSAAVVTGTCDVLSRLRRAIGDEFKFVLPTILPPLLTSLSHDDTLDGEIAVAVLHALEAFGTLMEDYIELVFTCLTRIVVTKTSFAVREASLLTLIRITKQTHSMTVHSGVVHTLLKVLAGVKDRPYLSGSWTSSTSTERVTSPGQQSANEQRMAMLSALALLEIGKRTARKFKVFVPVIAKALRASDLRKDFHSVYWSLRSFVLNIDPIVVRELLPEDNNGTAEQQVLQESFHEGNGILDYGFDGGLNRLGRQPRHPYERLNLQQSMRTQEARVYVAEKILSARWDVSLNNRPEDWVNWMNTLGAAMFQQSGSPELRACSRIAESYPPFTKELFNAVFLSCWLADLSAPLRQTICDSLDAALVSDTIPLNVLQAILNLFEYMDHDEKPLPTSTEKLAPTACKCGAFAKAIRYKEKEYTEHNGKPDLLKEDICGEDGLISIYEKLNHVESAMGTIKHYQEQAGNDIHEEWYEKLRKWDDALEVYEKGIEHARDTTNKKSDECSGDYVTTNHREWENELGRLRCLNELGQWREMSSYLQDLKNRYGHNAEKMKQLALEGNGASVAFDLGRWDEFEEWIRYIGEDTYRGCYYHTLLSVKRGKEDPSYLNIAEDYLHKARSKLDLELTARVSEAYDRAYTHVVYAQVFVELEEMISFLRMSPRDAQHYGKKRLHSLWSERLKGCKQDRYTWYRLLMIRALVMKPIEVKDQWLEFAGMCRKTNRIAMASEALRMLLLSCFDDNSEGNKYSEDAKMDLEGIISGQEDWNVSSILAIEDLDIKFACIKHMWAINERLSAYTALRQCQDEFWLKDTGDGLNEDADLRNSQIGHQDPRRILAGEVFSKLSKWGDRLLEKKYTDGINNEDPLKYAERATKIRPDWYKAWHYWGITNASRFDALMEREKCAVSPTNDPSKKAWHLTDNIRALRDGQPARKFFIEAVQGFFKAINLQGKTRLEDTLKVLTLWFSYGGHANLHVVFDECFKETNIAMWLEVVPQIIARLYTSIPGVQRGVKALMTRIGKEHPQLAVYPLTVAKTTNAELRRKSAVEILNALRADHPEIVEQSELVSKELIRSAILWAEMWYERLEEASKFYFVERDVDGMLKLLLPLHEAMEKGPQTPCEEEFIKEYGNDLHEAAEMCRRFQEEHGQTDETTLGDYLCHAWSLYHAVFRKIQRQQQAMLVFDISKISRLHEARDLQLAVPGTYDSDPRAPVIGIQAFGPKMHVVQSKQRPRKIAITGSNGRQYLFLLKGHEDLRQDERVMQVFNLVNKLFAKSNQRDILSGVEMKTYAVIALSANAGLIEWVPDCDTIHAIVKEYREVRKIMPNIEHKVMLRIAAEPDRLSLLHKVDLFECMLKHTVSVDIAQVLWLRSRTSEVWLDKRNTYARSLATTSMTGYLLGLGDRHPSNLMIERDTGKVLHIDFGDCFEVAMKREKYPEKIPFRLTRMLVRALEPCGVDGYFRHTAEATMDVLRQKNGRESLMAMMEAFVYDPLIRWKLIGTEEMIQLREEEAAPNENELNRRNSRTLRLPLPATDGQNADPVVRSLRETGSLSASVRLLRQQERAASAQVATENTEGALPTPSAGMTNIHDEEETDLANLQTPNEKARLAQSKAFHDNDESTQQKIANVSNERAQSALNRVEDKLRGTDFDPDVSLDVKEQVDLLIKQAQNIENLCALFVGWCAFW